MRINKFLASRTGYSRRRSEKLIEEGRVFLNGQRITSLSTYVNIKEDKVFLDGVWLSSSCRHIYIKFYKPSQVLTSHDDPQGRRIVMDCLPSFDRRIFCVGRLDYDSEGLLILTSNGDWAHRLLHPKYRQLRKYKVFLNCSCSRSVLESIRRGETLLEEGPVYPDSVTMQEDGSYEIEIREGRNREVRRIFSFYGYDVIRLIRLSFSTIQLSGLTVGKYAYLSSQEISGIL